MAGPGNKPIKATVKRKKAAVKRPQKVNKVDTHKKELIEALAKCHGVVSDACDLVGVSRTLFYKYMKADQDFANEAEDCQERAIDFVESKLFEKINGVTIQSYNAKGLPVIYDQPPSDTAIIFFLKTRGKARGYIEKTITENTNVNLNSEVIVTDEEALRIKIALENKY